MALRGKARRGPSSQVAPAAPQELFVTAVSFYMHPLTEQGLDLRTLLVAFDPDLQGALPVMLTALGVAVTITDDGTAALASVNDRVPDVIFIASSLPPVQVAQLAHAITEHPGAGPRPPAASPLLLTVLLDEEALSRRDEYLLSGATDCLSTPVTFAALKRVIDTARRGRQEAPVAPLDATVLAQLRSLETHSAGLLQRVVSAYIQCSTELLERLRLGLGHADPADVFEAAHALKSSSLNVGATRLAEIARVLESRARAGDTDYTDTLVGRMEEEHRQVCDALGEYSPRRSA